MRRRSRRLSSGLVEFPGCIITASNLSNCISIENIMKDQQMAPSNGSPFTVNLRHLKEEAKKTNFFDKFNKIFSKSIHVSPFNTLCESVRSWHLPWESYYLINRKHSRLEETLSIIINESLTITIVFLH